MAFQVNGGVFQCRRVFVRQPQHDIAIVVQDAAHGAGIMVVIQRLVRQRQQSAANGAQKLLRLQAQQIIPNREAKDGATRFYRVEKLGPGIGDQVVLAYPKAVLAGVDYRLMPFHPPRFELIHGLSQAAIAACVPPSRQQAPCLLLGSHEDGSFSTPPGTLSFLRASAIPAGVAYANPAARANALLESLDRLTKSAFAADMPTFPENALCFRCAAR